MSFTWAEDPLADSWHAVHDMENDLGAGCVGILDRRLNGRKPYVFCSGLLGSGTQRFAQVSRQQLLKANMTTCSKQFGTKLKTLGKDLALRGAVEMLCFSVRKCSACNFRCPRLGESKISRKQDGQHKS